MQISVRSLELIFTETDWPATERQLEVSIDQKGDWKVEKNSTQISWQTAMTEYQVSLKESGKSRADLWQLAANTAINIAIADANQACDDPGQNAETLILEYFTLC